MQGQQNIKSHNSLSDGGLPTETLGSTAALELV